LTRRSDAARLQQLPHVVAAAVTCFGVSITTGTLNLDPAGEGMVTDMQRGSPAADAAFGRVSRGATTTTSRSKRRAVAGPRHHQPGKRHGGPHDKPGRVARGGAEHPGESQPAGAKPSRTGQRGHSRPLHGAGDAGRTGG